MNKTLNNLKIPRKFPRQTYLSNLNLVIIITVINRRIFGRPFTQTKVESVHIPLPFPETEVKLAAESFPEAEVVASRSLAKAEVVEGQPLAEAEVVHARALLVYVVVEALAEAEAVGPRAFFFVDCKRSAVCIIDNELYSQATKA